MNAKRMLLLITLIMLVSCSKPADPGGATTSADAADARAESPLRNGPYVVCDVEDFRPEETPTLADGFTLKVGDSIDINDSERATGEVGLVASVKFHRASDATIEPVTLNMVGCCDRRRLAVAHQVDAGAPVRLITIMDETKKYQKFPGAYCPDVTGLTRKEQVTRPARLITVRFCYQRPDYEKKGAWECAGGVNPHGGDVHAVSK